MPCQDGEIRLQGGNSLPEGHLEVCRKQLWGTVCDDGWDADDATVVCRQLGYSTIGNNNCVYCKTGNVNGCNI